MDWSKLFWSLSKLHPNRRCSTILPLFFITHSQVLQIPNAVVSDLNFHLMWFVCFLSIVRLFVWDFRLLFLDLRFPSLHLLCFLLRFVLVYNKKSYFDICSWWNLEMNWAHSDLAIPVLFLDCPFPAELFLPTVLNCSLLSS